MAAMGAAAGAVATVTCSGAIGGTRLQMRPPGYSRRRRQLRRSSALATPLHAAPHGKKPSRTRPTRSKATRAARASPQRVLRVRSPVRSPKGLRAGLPLLVRLIRHGRRHSCHCYPGLSSSSASCGRRRRRRPSAPPTHRLVEVKLPPPPPPAVERTLEPSALTPSFRAPPSPPARRRHRPTLRRVSEPSRTRRRPLLARPSRTGERGTSRCGSGGRHWTRGR